MSENNNDKKYMELALRLAKKGAGCVSPNPMVGAVFVRDGKIIGQGYHRQYGEPHAEINAITDAGGDVRNATLYCTLEPCSHTDKNTPPCAQRLVREKIRGAVIASLDPNPKVNGAGVKILRDAGISVETGILGDESRELNRFFNTFMTLKRPYIMVKIAQTLDGLIARNRNLQTWITGSEARKKVHRWRSEYDAVLIGSGTLKSDDPQLTVRDTVGRDPLRILIDRDLSSDPGARILKGAAGGKTIVFCETGIPAKKIQSFGETGSEIIQIRPDKGGHLSIRDIINTLYEKNILSLLVEGGQTIFTRFLTEDLADELRIFMAPEIWGNGIHAVTEKVSLKDFHLTAVEKVSEDMLLTFRHGK
jgi:diaminohydroxyphosphoribosylaminopyrimidine deaminase/5-amino-6-(5-phosphoribosylamino)uracil reductase